MSQHRDILTFLGGDADQIKLIGASNFAEWKHSVVATMVRGRKYHVLRDVVHTMRRTPAPARSSDPAFVALPPSPPANTQGLPEDDRYDVWGYLFASLHSDILWALTEQSTDPDSADARQLWRELHRLYDNTDGQTAARLMKDLWRMELDEGGNAQLHLNKFSAIHTKLTQAGEAFSDRVFAYAILESLPKSYGNVSSNLFQKDELRSQTVFASVIKEWKRQSSPGSSDGSVVTVKTAEAFVAKAASKSPGPRDRGDRPKLKCAEHPNSSSHDAEHCTVLLRREIEELRKRKGSATGAFAQANSLPDDIHGLVTSAESLPVACVGESQRAPTYTIDSGASHHMVCSTENLSEIKPIGSRVIRTGGNNLIPVTHQGTLSLGNLFLSEVLYAPTLGFNLLSMSQLDKAGFSIRFGNGQCIIAGADFEVGVQVQDDGLYGVSAGKMSTSLVAQQQSTEAILYLHRSLGHLNWLDVWRLAKGGRLGEEWKYIVPVKTMNTICEPCILGKGVRLPSPPSALRAAEPNEIVHIDLWGPARVDSIGGSRYILTCYDDYSHRIQLYYLKSKNEALPFFRQYLALVENQCSTTVKLVRSDNGGEFTSRQFVELLQERGIVAAPIPPAAHAQNGRVERVHLTILNLVRTVLIDSGLSSSFWSEAANYAAYVRNRVPKAGTMSTPQELWTGRPCTLTQLRPFGSLVYVRDHVNTNKLAPRYFKAMLMGYRAYSESTIRWYDPIRKLFNYSRDYLFEPLSREGVPKALTIPPLTTTPEPATVPNIPLSVIAPVPVSRDITAPSPSSELDVYPSHTTETDDAPLASDQSDNEVEDSGSDLPIPPPPATKSRFFEYELTSGPRGESLALKGGRSSTFDETGRRILPPRNAKISKNTTTAVASPAIAETYIVALSAVSASTLVAYALLATDCPTTYRQARQSADWPAWRIAMDEELAKMIKYEVWEVVPRTAGMRVLKARWVFTRKIDGDTGLEAAFRARWVAKGFTQIQGLDFNEVFASVAHKDTVRIFLSLVNYHKLFCDQVDIKAAFLNGDLQETIYMEPAEGSSTPSTHVYRLRKSLYGLKQSPRCFNDKLDGWLCSQGFVPASADPCLYTLHRGAVFMMLTVHVDDQLIASNDRSALDAFKKTLNDKFPCTDHGAVNYFLGFNVIRDVDVRRLTISQEHYIEHLLERFDMSNSNPSKTPLPSNFKANVATDQEHEAAKHLPYPTIVGSILYAATISRPDLAFAASLLARFISKWSEEHFKAAKHLLRYIRGTSDLCLTFDAEASERVVHGFTDADWGGCADTRRSTTGYLFKVWGGLVAWKSKRQPTVALSTMEAELMAGCDATKQAIWLRQILQDLRLPLDGPIRIFGDNQGAIASSSNPGQHDRSKHIGIRGNFVRERVKDGTVAFQYVSTNDNTADLLTKSLDVSKTDQFSKAMGLTRQHLDSRD